MIFESHAHYSRFNFDNEFRAWRADGENYVAERFTREALLENMRLSGVIGILEPSVDFETIPAQLALAKRYPDFVFSAVGVHPTRCVATDWEKRERLEAYIRESGAVAVGETGLDYHRKRAEQRRHLQKKWFIYQIELADRLCLPLVLHIRKADRAALRILKRHRKMLHGGVAHCFNGRYGTARKYVSLGFAVGIGGMLLDGTKAGRRLCRTVARLPLSSVLVETDAPYVSPERAGADIGKTQRGKIRNSSLILPAIVRKIAEIKNIPADEVERETVRNTVRVFGLREELCTKR